jgi:hypothetical protein
MQGAIKRQKERDSSRAIRQQYRNEERKLVEQGKRPYFLKQCMLFCSYSLMFCFRGVRVRLHVYIYIYVYIHVCVCVCHFCAEFCFPFPMPIHYSHPSLYVCLYACVLSSITLLQPRFVSLSSCKNSNPSRSKANSSNT